MECKEGEEEKEKEKEAERGALDVGVEAGEVKGEMREIEGDCGVLSSILLFLWRRNCVMR